LWAGLHLWLGEQYGGGSRGFERILDAGTKGSDVPELYPRAGGLCIEMDIGTRDIEGSGESGREVNRLWPTEEVDGGGRAAQRDGAEWPVEYSPEVLVELGGFTGLDGGMTGVVGPEGQFVDEELTAGVEEHFHGEHSGGVDAVSDRFCRPTSFFDDGRGQRRWHDQVPADPGLLDGLDSRVQRHVS